MKNIVIVGFSGAGKSTVGRKLAKKLNLAFVDLDLYIEEKYHTAIPLLFKSMGNRCFEHWNIPPYKRCFPLKTP